MKKWFEWKSGRRLLSLALSIVMVLSLLPIPSIAVEGDGLCEHHTAHENCGYVAAVEGHDCDHVCGDECYTVTTDCKHIHDAGCYSDGELPAETPKEADACTHECTEESGCVTKTHTCVHTDHDDSCGYVEAVAGQPCGYDCKECAGEESKPTEPEEKTITEWEWVDDWDAIDPDSGDVLLPFASAENVAYFDDIVPMLPVTILVDGEELSLGEWLCEDYPMETGAYEGEYVFETTLPEGYVLEDGTNVLRLTVVLGDPEGVPVGMMTIAPSEPTQADGVYQLSTKEHLYWFAQKVNGGDNTINAVLTDDITVNSGVLNTDGSLNSAKTGSFEVWTPIGTVDKAYLGKFDGQNHKISGLYLDDTDMDYVGLFGYIGYYSADTIISDPNVTVQNVTIRDSYFAGKNYVGAVCGHANADYGLVPNLIQCLNYGTVAGNDYVGGICGGSKSGNTTNCQNFGKVSGSNYIGGVCGQSGFGANGKLSGCYNYGAVTASGSQVGGICGYNWGAIENSSNTGSVHGDSKVGGVCGDSGHSSYTTSITGCNNEGTVTGSGSQVGGICGYSYSQITNCHNTAAVQGAGGVGGVCGRNVNVTIDSCDNTASVTCNSSDSANYVGGVCGYNSNGVIRNCHNTAWVAGNGTVNVSHIGGVCGGNYAGTIESCYNTGAVQGYYYVGGVCGKSQSSATIKFCYNTGALQGDDWVGGVCGTIDNSSISDCYNSSTITCNSRQFGGICGTKPSNSSLTNVYFDDIFGAIRKAFQGQAVCSENRTTAQFASGEVAYLLNGRTNAGTWKQNLDTGTRDETPNFTSAAVYQATSGECLPGYTNNSNGAKNHRIENHQCIFCGYRDQYPITVSGIENITAKSKSYDGTTKAELNYNNLVLKNNITSEEVTGVSLSVSGNFDTPDAGQDKTVTIQLKLTDTDEYYLVEECQTTTTKANIDCREVTVTITPPSGTYGNVTPATAKLNNVVPGDNVPVTLHYVGSAYDGEAYDDTNVPQKAGSYDVYATIIESNYTLTGKIREKFVIQKATVTTPTLQSVTYDGKTHSPVIAADALYELSENFSKKDADTYQLTLALKDTNNHKWDDKNGATSFTIEKKSLTVTAENKTVTYGDPPPTYTASYEGFVTGETATSLGLAPTLTCSYRAGDSVMESGYKISVSSLDLQNYEISYTPGTLTVNPKTLEDDAITLTVADENPVYTGSALTPDVSVVWGDKALTKDTDYTVDYSNNVNAGSTPQVTITGTGNYTGTKSKSFTIQPRDISSVAITVTGDGSLKYSGSEIKPAVTVTNGDYAIAATDYEVSYENNVAAGQNTATVKLTGKNNYTGTASQTFSIEKADSTVSTAPAAVSGLTYTGQAQTLVTDGSTSHGTMVYSLEENGTYTSNLPTGTNAGSYTVWYKVQGNDNHLDSAPVSVTCSIAQKALTVKANNKTITYGEAPANSGVTYDGFVNGETKLDGELTYTYTYSQYGNVGRYDIIPSGLTSGNYDITFANGTLTVNQKEIGITWGNTQFTYSGSEQKPAATPTGLVNNDAITLTVSGEQTNAGSGYTAKVDAIEGTKAGNYALPQSVTTPFSIEKKEVTITGTTVAATKVYDGNTTAQITSDGELQGKCDGDDLTIVCGTAAYDNKNVGKSKPVTFSSFSLGGSAKDNYELTGQPTSVTASITQKPVTLAIKVGENLFDGTNGVNYSTSLEEGQSFVENDDVAIESGNATFAYCYPAENIPVTFTAFSLTGADAGNYSITNPTPENVTGSIKVSNRYLNLENNGDFAGQTEVWVDGVACPVRADDGTYAALPESGDLLTTYTYKQGTSTAAHENYPTGMALYSIVRDDGGAKLQKIDELDNLLQYSGCSIRINGKPGIRMITSLTKEAKEALKKGELAGYTLEEYGTVVAWDVGADMQLPLTLGNGNKHNYAYKKGVSDPVFSNVDNLTQYTNVLVWDSLTDAQLAQNILMRPYIILSKDGETVTLYGGTVSRSIGYVAQQNADTFPKGSAGYNYVHDIIDRVEKYKQNSGSTTTPGG